MHDKRKGTNHLEDLDLTEAYNIKTYERLHNSNQVLSNMKHHTATFHSLTFLGNVANSWCAAARA